MKALTLWQPWASLCVQQATQHTAIKWVETRSWAPPATLLGGRLAIHAAARNPRHDEVEPINDALDRYGLAFSDRGREWSIDSRPLGEEWTSSNTTSDHMPQGEVIGSVTVWTAAQMGAALPEACEVNLGLWIVLLGEDHLRVWRCGRDGLAFVWRCTGDITDQRPFGIFAPGRWAWFLFNPVRFADPVPATGRQQVWNWSGGGDG